MSVGWHASGERIIEEVELSEDDVALLPRTVSGAPGTATLCCRCCSDPLALQQRLTVDAPALDVLIR